MSTISSLPTSYQSIVYQSLFKKADANSDGTVSSDELSSSLDEIKTTLGDSSLDASSLFTTLDSDNSGGVSAAEFKKGLSSIVSDASSSSASDATTSRQEVISSFLSGVQANMVSTLLYGTSSSTSTSSSYSSLGDLYTLLDKQYGTGLTTYSSNGSTGSSSLVGSLLNTSA